MAKKVTVRREIRFIRFGYDQYYPGGGIEDALGFYPTWRAAASSPIKYDTECIYDTWTGRVWYPKAVSHWLGPAEFKFGEFTVSQ